MITGEALSRLVGGVGRIRHRVATNAVRLQLDPSSTVSEVLVGSSLRKALIWRAFIFGGADSKRARDAK
jgi:hypothetical protein